MGRLCSSISSASSLEGKAQSISSISNKLCFGMDDTARCRNGSSILPVSSKFKLNSTLKKRTNLRLAIENKSQGLILLPNGIELTNSSIKFGWRITY